MSGIEINATIPVKDVMSSPVITVFEDDKVERVAKLMAKHDIGSIIITDHKENPVGLITERDLALRVTVKDLLPSKIKAKKVMSSPLRTIDLNIDITECAKMMQKYNNRRLVVMDKGKMIGIVSSKDIVAITPTLIEILMEKARINPSLTISRKASLAGYCERCRQWYDSLVNVDGRYICEECSIEFGSE